MKREADLPRSDRSLSLHPNCCCMRMWHTTDLTLLEEYKKQLSASINSLATM